MTTTPTSAPAEPITVREALHLFWEADHYPIPGNADARDACALDQEARAKAAHAIPSPDDPPEFAHWLVVLRDPLLSNDGWDDIMSALRDLFEPE